MSSEDPIRVTLTGDRTGAYVVSEERPDGSLVLEPDVVQRTPPRHDEGAKRSAGTLGELLLGGLFKDRATATVPELLHRWGVTLNPGEDIRQFLTLQINEVNGFAAVTTSRLIFMPQGNARGPAEEYRLAAVRNVEVVGRRRTRLRVETSRGGMTIEAGRDEIQQLAAELAPPSPSSTGAEPA